MSDHWRSILREHRARLRVTQVELARRTGLSPDTVRKYEDGRRFPSRQHLTDILDALKLERGARNQILEAAGFASDGGSLGGKGYPRGMFNAEEAVAEVMRHPWPAFVLDEYMKVLGANRAAQAVWCVDLERDFLDPVERNLFSVASTPRFADRCLNWDEAVRLLLSIFKGKEWNHEQLENPQSPYFKAVLDRFLAGDPGYVARLADLWQQAESDWEEKMRTSYPVVWKDPIAGLMHFECLASPANHDDATAFNDWIPIDAETWLALDRLAALPANDDTR